MAVDVLTVAAPPQAPLSMAVAEGASFEQRWAAWQARGAAHDRAVRRKMAVAAPILVASSNVCVQVRRDDRVGGDAIAGWRVDHRGAERLKRGMPSST